MFNQLNFAHFSNLKTVKYLLFAVAFSIIGLIYSQGITGSFYYDDLFPLGKLVTVTDFQSALKYIFGDASGVLGRQISMLSFLPHVNDWPNNSEAFFIGNIIVHLLCGAFVFSIAFLLLSLKIPVQHRKLRFYIAIACAFLWMVLPIHAATVFIAIQRMAQLSTLFILMGLTIYLYGLLKQQQVFVKSDKASIKAPVALQLSGIIAGTLLAMFSKENGILLPVFVLVLEITILSNCKELLRLRKLRIAGGLFSLSITLFALAIYAYKIGNNLDFRDYSLMQRVMTQPLILLEYIRLSFLPVIELIHPFHDNYSVVRNATSLAVILPVCVIFISFLVAVMFRKKQPLLSFAILWFFTAHLIESTTIPLEPFFLHRNYLALVGPAIAIAIALSQLKRKRIMAVSYCGYFSILVLVTVMTSSLWGNQMHAAEKWFIATGNSERASMHFAKLLFKSQRQAESTEVLNHYVQQCGSCLMPTLQLALVQCSLNSTQSLNSILERAITMVPDAIRIRQVPGQLQNLSQLHQNGLCSEMDIQLLYNLNYVLINEKSSDVIDHYLLTENIKVIETIN